jgi:hypothetical protein
MRPKTKDDAQKLTLTLSAPARELLMEEACRRGISRTQVVEDLINEFSCKNSRLWKKRERIHPRPKATKPKAA